MPHIKSTRLLLVPGLLSLLVVACVYDPVYYGKPAHAPRHYHYEPWGYYYYPGASVYFHYSTGFYYYPSGSVWIRSRILPPLFRLDPRSRVYLRIESERPYRFHHEHREKYRPRRDYRPTPELDRKERDHHRDRHYQQQRSKGQQREAAPLHKRPTPPPHRERDEKHKPQPKPKTGIRFDSPPQHQPRPLVPDATPRPPRDKKKQKSSSKQQRQHEEQHEEQSEQQEPEKRHGRKYRRDEEREKRYR